jgi:hypothetical protein
MTSIDERHLVDCPYHFARSYVEDVLKPLATNKTERTIELTVPLGDGTLAKDVNVVFTTASDPRHFDEPWGIHWEPKGGGPYPTFDGTLAVRADETYDKSVLELDGQYAPPLGAAGALFDAVVGKRIAELTAQGLLKRIGSGLEALYRAEEAAKKAKQ